MRKRNRYGLRMLPYIVQQAFGLCFSQQAYTWLLLLCYGIAFSLPAVMQAYNESLAKPFLYDADYALMIDKPSKTQLQSLTTTEGLLQIMATATAGQAASATVAAGTFGSFSWITYADAPLSTSLMWTVSVEAGEYLHNLCPEAFITTGRQLSASGGLECLVGDSTIPRGNAEKLLGQTLMIDGRVYEIVGIIEAFDGIFATMPHLDYALTFRLYFRTAGDIDRDAIAMADALEAQGYFVSAIENRRLQQAEARAYTKGQTDFYALCASFGYLICFIGTLCLVALSLYDHRKRIMLKLTLGARISHVVLEYFVYYLCISFCASLFALLFVRIASSYFLWIGTKAVAASTGTLGLLLGISLISSLLASCLAAGWIARKLA